MNFFERIQMYQAVLIGDVDLEILRRQRQSGTVRQLKDRRKDIYSIKYKQ